MTRSWMKGSAALFLGAAMACASTHEAGPAEALSAGQVVTNPREEAFPIVVTRAPVAIDGDLSDWPAVLPVGKLASPDGSRYVLFRIFAHGDRYYAAFQVADSTPSPNRRTGGNAYDGDTIELFLGTHAEPHGSWGKGDVQIFLTFNPAAPHVYNNVATTVMKDTRIVERQTAGGWLIEASFTAADAGIAVAEPGAPVWVDVALDNSNGAGRVAQYQWLGDGHLWNTPSQWKPTVFVAAP